MISYPPIDQLLEKVDSRYSLAVLAAKRAHQLEAGNFEMLDDYKSDKPVGLALEEIAAGKVEIDPKSNHKEAVAEAIDEKEQTAELAEEHEEKKHK